MNWWEFIEHAVPLAAILILALMVVSIARPSISRAERRRRWAQAEDIRRECQEWRDDLWRWRMGIRSSESPGHQPVERQDD